MARRLRLQYPGAVFHVMSRGNRRLPIFEDDDDRRRFFATVADASRRYHVTIYAACLMPNHYHLVLDTPRGNLSDTMQFINGVYSQASNRRHHRTGHLFGDRFRSIVVQQESYLRRVCRYVVVNPVRARLTTEAAAWPWSTYRATAGLEDAPPWLHTEWMAWAFDAQTAEDAQQKYQRYVNEPVARKTRINAHAVALGTRAFKKAVGEEAKRRQADRPLPLACRALSRAPLPSLFVLGGGDERQLTREERIRDAHVTHGYYLSEIAAFLGLDRTTVSKAFRKAQAN